jgi:hypothetical protein
MAVSEDVVDTVILAVHLHGNDTVGVIGLPLTIRVEHRDDALQQKEARGRNAVVDQLDRRSRAMAQLPCTGRITIRVSFPCRCTARITVSTTSTVTITSALYDGERRNRSKQ